MRVYFMLIVCVFLCSCQSGEKRSYEGIKLNVLTDPSTIDPRKARNLNDKVIASMLFDGLMRLSSEEQPVPSLAKDVQVQEGGKVYLFTLREAHWTNGDRITPKDFIYSWTSSLLPETISETSQQLFCIEGAKEVKEGDLPPSCLGVKELDECTLEVRLKEPDPHFLHLLCSPIFFPIHKEKAKRGHYLETCGPFSLVEWKHNDVLVFEKNSSYWDEASVQMPRIEMIVVSEATELLLFENKEIDWVGSPLSVIATDVIERLKDEEVLQTFPLYGTSFFRFNVESAPLNEKKVRRAFNYSIDKQVIANHTLQGMQRPAYSLVPDLVKDPISKEIVVVDTPLELSLLYASSARAHLIAQAVQSQLKEKGITLALEACEPKVYYSRLKNKEYQVALSSWIADYHKPEDFLSLFQEKNSPFNGTNWESIEYKTLLQKAKTQEGEEQKNTLRECELVLLEEAPISPLFHYQGVYLKNPNLHGMVVTPTGMLDFKWAYLSNTE